MGSKQSTAAAAPATTKAATGTTAKNHATIVAEAQALAKRLQAQTNMDAAQLARNMAETTAQYDRSMAAVSRLGVKRQTPAEKAAEDAALMAALNKLELNKAGGRRRRRTHKNRRA